MELLIQQAAVPRRRASRPRRAAMPRGLAVSVLLHGGLVIATFSVTREAAVSSPPEPIAVELFAEPPVLPPEPVVAPREPAGPEPPRPRRATARTARRAEAPPTPAPEHAEAPPPATIAASDPTRTSPESVAVAAASPAPMGAVARGTPGRAGMAGLPGGAGDGLALGPPPLTVAQRRQAIDGYLKEVLRTRIREVFRYPAAARELELSGAVIVHATIDRGGHLLSLRIAGPCAETILCEDALRTIRAAAPFPPVPAALGDTLSIDVPLTYAFGGAS
jgi:protein TonB